MHDENAVSSRRLPTTTSLKKSVNENARPTSTVKKTGGLKAPNPASLGQTATDGKPADKTPARPRNALASLTNNTPQQSRIVQHPPISKSLAAQTPSYRRPALIKKPSNTQLAKTPSAKPTSSLRKPLSVYTPARAPVKRDEGSEEELEYMPPKMMERPYVPPTPLRNPAPDKRDEACLSDPERQLAEPPLYWETEETGPALRLGGIDSPRRDRTALSNTNVHDDLGDDFRFDS